MPAIKKLDPLEQLARQIEEISTLPQVAMNVIRVANNPESSAQDLKEVVEGDAALSSRVLRCVNSSAYALRVRITNLQQAIAYLGLKQIRNLAMTASVSELFREQGVIGTYSRSGLWRHLVSVGIGARLIAMRLRLQNFEDAFLAGLLHDVGLILEDQHAHMGFCSVVRSFKSGRLLTQIENEILGFDHTTLGERFAESWGFPEEVRVAVRYHHTPMNYRGEWAPVVRCVELANLICSFKDITSAGCNLLKFSASSLNAVGLNKDDLVVLAADMDQELAANANLFQM